MLLRESSATRTKTFALHPDGERLLVTNTSKRSTTSFFHFHFLRDAFLPMGFPDSVTPDYIEYALFPFSLFASIRHIVMFEFVLSKKRFEIQDISSMIPPQRSAAR